MITVTKRPPRRSPAGRTPRRFVADGGCAAIVERQRRQVVPGEAGRLRSASFAAGLGREVRPRPAGRPSGCGRSRPIRGTAPSWSRGRALGLNGRPPRRSAAFRSRLARRARAASRSAPRPSRRARWRGRPQRGEDPPADREPAREPGDGARRGVSLRPAATDTARATSSARRNAATARAPRRRCR